MSRSFRSTYLGRPYQAVRGWHWGREREVSKATRYRFANLYDEEGTPELPTRAGRKWHRRPRRSLWTKPDKNFEIIERNGRKFLRLRRQGLKRKSDFFRWDDWVYSYGLYQKMAR